MYNFYLFRNICSQVYITFCDKLIPNDPGFTLGLPMWMLYHDMLQAVAERVSVDQRKLQIYFSVKYVFNYTLLNSIPYSYSLF